LLAQVDERPEPVDEGNDQGQAGVERPVVPAEALVETGPRLGDNPHRTEENEHDQEGDDSEDDETGVHDYLLDG
jgi:hypothetical protein